MSTWIIDNGDILSVDDSLPLGQHRAQLERDVRSWDQTTRHGGTRPRVSFHALAVGTVHGKNYKLHFIGRPLDALRAAAYDGWTEQAAE